MYNSSIRNKPPIPRRLADVGSHSSGCWLLCWSTNQDGFQGAILMSCFTDTLDEIFFLKNRVALMELLLTMDVPRGRIELREDNVLWLLENLVINNKDRPEFQTAIDLLNRISEISE